MIKTIKWLSVVSTMCMIFVLLGGALVTKTDSGMGCGRSWPLCEGQILPSEITPQLVIELSHRIVSGIGGIMVGVMSLLAWIKLGHIREVKFLSFMSIFFLVFQALIGAAAVMWGQSDFVLALHFGISLISFAAVFLLMLLIFEVDRKMDTRKLFIQKKHRIEIYLLTGYTLLVVYTGALVRHANASLVCKSWPFCNNSTPFAFSDFRLDQWIQMGHRLAAGILFFWTLSFFIRMIRYYRNNKVMYWGSVALIVLIFFQVFFGAMIIFTTLNLAIALMHALVISCFFSLLCYYFLLATRCSALEQVNTKTVNVGHYSET
ncbi:heme A synthase [Virgibacillus sp. 179-BFC.A HS]|uniref:Heme A synthase n=1 Tax=Tigheibacillus jepli TaxID=3035914 RepID=A0ABU5CI44_9BACI|nr:heme A synthase [Virgibacillus sp. 179-BFC.A HS]MDY0405999.1 heme A synthase [Virgibacillus sp. 179-BFC.A HS]